MQVDIKRATPKVVEEISQRITPIVENEAKYTLVRSHRGAYSQEYLYVTQHEERITSLVLWSEDAETLSIVELKGNIQLDNVDEIANALKVKGLDRLHQHADRSGCIRFRFYQKTGRTLWYKKRFHFRERSFWFIPGKFRQHGRYA